MKKIKFFSLLLSVLLLWSCSQPTDSLEPDEKIEILEEQESNKEKDHEEKASEQPTDSNQNSSDHPTDSDQSVEESVGQAEQLDSQPASSQSISTGSQLESDQLSDQDLIERIKQSSPQWSDQAEFYIEEIESGLYQIEVRQASPASTHSNLDHIYRYDASSDTLYLQNPTNGEFESV